MSLGKRGELITFVVIGVMILASALLFLSNGGITGAAIGIAEPNLLVEIEPELSSNISDNISNNFENFDSNLSEDDFYFDPFMALDVLEINNSFETKEDIVPFFDLSLQATCDSWPCNCNDVINTSINLSTNLICNSTAINIGANDIVIDCLGNELNYSLDGTLGYGISNSGYNNVTIKNCKINEGSYTTLSKYGIFFIGLNGTIFNNTITTQAVISDGIRLTSADENNVSNNFVNATGASADGISLISSLSNLIYNNSINNFNENSNSIYLTSAYNNNISDNSLFTSGVSGVGIYLTDSDLNSIENNQIITNNSYGKALYLLIGSDSNDIINNNISTSGYFATVIYLSTSDNNQLLSNIIFSSGEISDGLYIYSSDNSILNSNNITVIGEESRSIYSSSTLNLTLNDNNLYSPNGLSLAIYGSSSYLNHSINVSNYVEGLPLLYNFSLSDQTVFENVDLSATYGQVVCASCSNVTYNNVTFSNDGLSFFYALNSSITNSNFNVTNGTGITVYSGSQTQITNNTLVGKLVNTTLRGNGILLWSSSNNITNNNLSQFSIALQINGDNNQFTSNYFANNNISYDLINADGNNFSNEFFTNSSSAIYGNNPYYSCTSDTFRDSQFFNNTLDFNFLQGPDSNFTFINSTINRSRIYTYPLSTVYVKWYVDVNVTDSNNVSLENTTILVYNSIDELEDTQSTDVTGMARLTIPEYYKTDGTITYYITPSTINAIKNNYTGSTSSLNLIDIQYSQVNFSLSEITCNSTITTDAYLGNNFTCNGGGFIIGADNVTLFGNGYSFVGNSSGVGINLTNKKYVQLANISILNFSTGIEIINANFSNFTNVVISNNSYGVIFNGSNGNAIYDSTIFNNSENSIFAINDGGTNNSLVNVSINLSTINVSSSANLFVKWYVDVNTTYNSGAQLSGANLSGYFNDTGSLDQSITTGSGLSRLTLTELKVNSSGTTYLTPHNISLVFAYLGTNISNSSVLNLSQTNNTNLNLSLTLNCTSPYSGMTLTTDTSFCPGTYSVSDIRLNTSGVTLTCINTILNSVSTGWGLYTTANNITINGCNITSNSLNYGIYMNSVENNSIINTTINIDKVTAKGVQCLYCSRINVTNSEFNAGYGIYFLYVNYSSVTNNNFYYGGSTLADTFFGSGISLSSADHNTFVNNTFDEVYYGVVFDNSFYSDNNTFYHNNFSTINNYNYNYFNTLNNYFNYFNTSVNVSGNMSAQGNTYLDYCDMGADLNGDGYANNISSEGANDWPYSENITAKVYDPTTNNSGVVDYGPKIINCPAEVVYLGGGGGGGFASAVSAAIVEVPAQEEKKDTKKEIVLEEFYNAKDAFDNLKRTDAIVERVDGITVVSVVLENTGIRPISLFPDLNQEVDDAKHLEHKPTVGTISSEKYNRNRNQEQTGGSITGAAIITEKLESEPGIFDTISALSYSGNSISGRLLKATLVNPEEIIIPPGGKVDRKIEIKEGLISPREIKIQFSTFGETVYEQDVAVKRSAVSGSAIDLDKENKLIDVYVIIVPGVVFSETYGINGNSDSITGGAVVDFSPNLNMYTVEMNINSKDGKKSYFSDFYGPYKVHTEEALVFAQQYHYDSVIYSEDYQVQTKIYRGGELVTENKLDLNLGDGKELTFKDRMFKVFSWSIPLLLGIMSLIFFMFIIFNKSSKKKRLL